MFFLIVPSFLEIVMLVLGLGSAAGLGLIIYRLFLRPALDARAGIDSPPPEEGFTMEFVLDHERTRSISVGQLDSDIKTRMNGVKEDHLVLRVIKDRETEDYEISLIPSGPVFYRPPHARKIEPISTIETFASRELIGYPAVMRVAASVRDNRPLQYLEFELSTDYFINQFGEEKMKFFFTLKRIYPSLDKNSRNKKGIYMFGRLQVEQESDEDAQ